MQCDRYLNIEDKNGIEIKQMKCHDQYVRFSDQRSITAARRTVPVVCWISRTDC